MKKLLLSTVLGLGLYAPISPAHAQQVGCGVNFTPQVGINCANVRQATYVANINALVPAASASDFFCIDGAASKTIHVRKIRLSGTAGTLITTPISIRRITGTLDTGTPSTAVSGPRALNSSNPTAAAAVTAYDATGGNPTVGGTAALMAVQEITLGVSATAGENADRLEWDFGTATDAYSQGLDIVAGATTTQYCLNLGAVSVSSGKLNGTITWTEE